MNDTNIIMDDIIWTNQQKQEYKMYIIDHFTEFLLDIYTAFSQKYLSRILVTTGPLFLSVGTSKDPSVCHTWSIRAGAAVNASALPALFTRRGRHFEDLL